MRWRTPIIVGMTDNEITFSISFETTVAYTNSGEKYLESMYYNEFVNMIVRDSRWPNNVSFVATNSTVGRLVSLNWDEVDFPNMIETLVTNDYTVTITDINTYTITKTVSDAETDKKQRAGTIVDKKSKSRHKRKQ